MGNNAMVDVMFAASGLSPANNKVGKVMNEPPPANVFCVPAYRPDKAINNSSDRSR